MFFFTLREFFAFSVTCGSQSQRILLLGTLFSSILFFVLPSSFVINGRYGAIAMVCNTGRLTSSILTLQHSIFCSWYILLLFCFRKPPSFIIKPVSVLTIWIISGTQIVLIRFSSSLSVTSSSVIFSGTTLIFINNWVR